MAAEEEQVWADARMAAELATDLVVSWDAPMAATEAQPAAADQQQLAVAAQPDAGARQHRQRLDAGAGAVARDASSAAVASLVYDAPDLAEIMEAEARSTLESSAAKLKAQVCVCVCVLLCIISMRECAYLTAIAGALVAQ